MTHTTGYRVLVVDDHPIYLRGLRDEFEDAGDVHVVGECATGEDAVALAERERPDVVLVDLRIPPAAGVSAQFCGPDVIRRIVERVPETRVLVLSMHEEPEHVRAALAAGALGYLRKEEKEIVQAVRTVAEGKMVLDPLVGRALVVQQPRPLGRLPFRLTGAEGRMLELMVGGLTNPQIAAKLRISPKTVANRVLEVQHKLQVADRDGVVEKAREIGFTADGGHP
ncbi:response regulator transcription factor [Umezawaea sp.]|uniref:response regulator transcription factor n=1 Tax=Umezawaea sp. TaxID=1955258 RepID=UPI002ED22082